MINICVQNMIELSVYMFAHTTLYWSIDDAPDEYIRGTLCLLFVSKHASVSLSFVNKRGVSWSFVCQLKIDMFFAPSHDDTEQFVKFHHYTLGPHESMGRM